MKNILKSALVGLLLIADQSQAREVVGTPPNGTGNIKPQSKYFYTMAAGCKQPAAQVDLDINNVRTTIMNGGDMWWNLVSAKYEVPKVTDPNGTRKHSIFSGALWIGGLDAGNNLKLAAMTYRQNGVDFFAGPLNVFTHANPSIAEERCDYHDKIYKVTRDEIERHIADFADGTIDGTIPKAFIDWPAMGDAAFGESKYIAPFVDVDNDGIYNAATGDYPKVAGDQALWFVYNDKGNIHSETQGVPIGLEMQTTAFAFTTNDEINNMTFYTTKITNFGEPVKETYFGQWIDPDLGNYSDDYVGCDTTRNLGYCYNADNNDEGILGYGLNPPTVGLDFFRGPKDNNGKELGMSYFVYYNNDFSVTGNPFRPAHFYNFLKGLWHDGTNMTYGGTGYGGASKTNYMFSGDPTLPCTPNNWTENCSGNKGADRRFLQTSGPFDLTTGAVNEITVGAVWARASSGGATGSLGLLKIADDAAQKLFNNNFELIEGPRAPDMAITEFDQGLTLNLTNTNNPKSEGYLDSTLGADTNTLLKYHFQGYLIYQLKDAGISASELRNPDVARLVFQVDTRDNVSQLINKKFDPKLKQYAYEEMVDGQDAGIKHTFKITDDRFATGDKNLVNFKQYYYTVVAYANLTNDPLAKENIQYLEGRKNIVTYKATPHKVLGRDNTIYKTNAGPKITQLSGLGNGGNAIDLTEETIKEILTHGKAINPVYDNGRGPIRVDVIDPAKLGTRNFELSLVEKTPKSNNKDSLNPFSTTWILKEPSVPGSEIYSDFNISRDNEQLIDKYGISINIKQTIRPGNVFSEFDKKNGFIESSITWKDNSIKWLNGIMDNDVPAKSIYNWIRAGVNGKIQGFSQAGAGGYEYDFATGNGEAYDPIENYEKICDRKMAPYKLCARARRDASGNVTFGPASDKSAPTSSLNRLEDLASIDLVITPDRSKWSKCVVVEMSDDASLSQGNRDKWQLRKHPSWEGVFDSKGNPIYNPVDSGYSKFPGYAINVETGERLNIIFGEDSWLIKDNGADMVWNPTTNVEDLNGPIWGGKHHIFVCGATKVGTGLGKTYDEGKSYFDILRANGSYNPNSQQVSQVTGQVMWVMMPFLSSGFVLDKKNIVPNNGEVAFKIRMSKPYTRFNSTQDTVGLPHYQFKTEGIGDTPSVDALTTDLDLIGIVPNPYYGYAQYENNQLDTRTRITNLPPKCTIKIFTVSGTLIRTINKDEPSTFVDWDLKNQAQVPIASGLYLINITVPGLGERTIKWFGAMRPVDLDTF
ncbi:MAG: hypothetical protein EXR21_04500 [Flavobacteriaceae bacterium]|nr:hypothetical protein [Flavobacteriaceae bacterium]